MTIGSFLKKRKASFMKGLEHAEAVAAKTLEILNIDCGLLTVLQEDLVVKDKESYRNKPHNKRLKTCNENNIRKDSMSTQGPLNNGEQIFSSMVLSPHEEILLWLDEVAIKAKNDSLNQEEKNVIGQFINELLSTSNDEAFVEHMQDELEKSGLYDYLATTDSRGFEVSMAEEVTGFESYEIIKKERKIMDDEYITEIKEEEVKDSSLETSPEHCFLLFLQRVLSDDQNIGPSYNKVIEVLQKSGMNSDLITKLKEKPQEHENTKVEELKKQLEEALAAKSEAEAKLGQLCGKIEASPEETMKIVSNTEHFIPPPPPPMPGTLTTSIPPPPPMPGATGPAPPPMGGLLPPAPGMPLPPSMPTGPDVLPLGLKPKKKWRNSGSFRKANWKKIVPQNMTEKAFWLKVQEESLAKSHILDQLDEKFSAQPKQQTGKDQQKKSSTSPKKKIRQVKVLESKIAQNLSILLGGSFKQMSYDTIKKCLLRCDGEVFTESIIEQLIQYLPPSEQLNKLKEYKDSYDDLVEAEQFCLKLSEINRLLPRLKAMQFKHRYFEMEQDFKPNIISVIAACEEAKKSSKFSKILELILLVGNYMNSCSKNEQAFGFEMSFLPKLKNTKDVNNKSTLLHFLVETVEKDFPELLSFHEELPHIDEASKVSMEVLGNILKQISTSLGSLEAEIRQYRAPQNEDDKFLDVMEEFCKDARVQSDVMLKMYETLENLHQDLAEYFVYDKRTYSLKNFFTDLASFKNGFLEARKDNEKKRELEEKREKARLAKEKADKEKKQKGTKSATKKVETLDDSGMECLLNVLKQTGEFSKQRRKRPHQITEGERKPELARSRSRTDAC